MSETSDPPKEDLLQNAKSYDTISDPTGFFQAAGRLLGWGRLTGATVLDASCGSGRSSATLLRVFPDIDKVIAIDTEQTRIDESKSKYPHPKIEYLLADIEEKNSLRCVGNMSKIVSFNCFNFANSDLEAFWNIYHHMAYGGTAAVLLQTSSTMYDVFQELTEHEEWKEYMMEVYEIVPKSHVRDYCREIYYKSLLRSIGFEVILCKERDKYFTFSSKEECRDAIFEACPFTRNLPDDRRQEFMDYAFQLFMDQNTSSETLNGLPYLKQRTVSILVRKPPKPSV